MKPHLVIIGLGNPGMEHKNSRHNAGFRALDLLSEKFGEGEWLCSQKFLCRMQEARIITVPVLLVQPTTYMNRSGECVRKMVEFYKLNPRQQILVLCDDIDLQAGEMRLRMTGGPGTHNGLRSIVVVLGEEFPRIRIGIGGSQPSGDDLSAWVLSAPSEHEQKAIAGAISGLPEKIKKFIMDRADDA
ncbi:aminoacyl-tRNA hydrolase [Candidatus Peregrinibacteria bacterium]|nr:aminoacyl-tRNA hydrolase [Candidatus Peregrinibacteria bacterium]